MVPLPLYGALWGLSLAALSLAQSSDAAFGALLGGALPWPFAIVTLVVIARRRFGRISFANGVVVSAIVSLAVGTAGTIAVMGAMASGIRG